MGERGKGSSVSAVRSAPEPDAGEQIISALVCTLEVPVRGRCESTACTRALTRGERDSSRQRHNIPSCFIQATMPKCQVNWQQYQLEDQTSGWCELGHKGLEKMVETQSKLVVFQSSQSSHVCIERPEKCHPSVQHAHAEGAPKMQTDNSAARIHAHPYRCT